MKPILIEIPMPIETPRLILRPPVIGDGALMNEAVCESIEELKVFLPWASVQPIIEESEENNRQAIAKWITREDLRILMIDKETGKLAGGTGLHRIKWEVPSFEIGYWVRTCFNGRGYAREASNALTRYAFKQLGARRVELKCDAHNVKSEKIIRSLNFEFEGRHRNDGLRANTKELRDTLVFSKISPEGLPELDVRW